MKINAPTKLTTAQSTLHVLTSAMVSNVNVTKVTTVADKSAVMRNNANQIHVVRILVVLRNARDINVSARTTTTDQLLVTVELAFSIANTRTNATMSNAVNMPNAVMESVIAARDTTKTVMTVNQRSTNVSLDKITATSMPLVKTL